MAKKAAKPNGRPTKYNAKIHDDLVFKLVRDNKSNEEIVDIMSIARSTFNEWLDKHESFRDNYKKGLEAKLDKVERNMYQRSAGMEYKEVTKIVVKDKNGKDTGKMEIREVTKYLPPDVGASAFILKTQRRDKWTERQEIQHSGAIPIVIENDLKE